jgi:hypothetical protein
LRIFEFLLFTIGLHVCYCIEFIKITVSYCNFAKVAIENDTRKRFTPKKWVSLVENRLWTVIRRDFVEATELALGKSWWVTVILAYLPRYQIYTKLIVEGFTMI